MNPNIWGPDVWTVLHGLSFLNPSSSSMPVILDSLNDVLPCIFCRESFRDYFNIDDAKEVFEMGNGHKYVVYLHNKVDDKLEKQRLEKFINACEIKDNKLIEIMNENFRIVSNRPTFDIMQKRFNLRKDYPFSLRNVYMMIMSFLAVLPDHKERISIVLPSLAKMITHIGNMLKNEDLISISLKMKNDLKLKCEDAFQFYEYIYNVQMHKKGKAKDGWKILRNNMHSP